MRPVLAPVLLLFLFQCTSKGPEAQVRTFVQEAIGMVQKTDIKGVQSLLADNFQLLPSGKSLIQIKPKLKYALLRYRGHAIYHPRPNVELDSSETQAKVSFPFLFMRSKREQDAAREQDEHSWLDSLTNKSHLLRINLTLQKADTWQITNASLARFVGTGFREIR